MPRTPSLADTSHRNLKTRTCHPSWSLAALLTGMLPLLISAGEASAPKAGKVKSPVPTSAPAAKGVVLPPDKCVVCSGTLQVVAVTGNPRGQAKLTVDGKPVECRVMPIGTPGKASPYSGGKGAGKKRCALVATTKLPPGQHVISLGSDKARVFVAASEDGAGAPAGWPTFRSHPGRVSNCALCHETTERDGVTVLGLPREPDACFACHDRDEFKLTHSHRIESLAACRMCHAGHGGTTKSLLIDKPKALCLKCHD